MTSPRSPSVSTSFKRIAWAMPGQPSLPVCDVRQESELASPLDRVRELRLVAPARAGHARRADLALVADRAAQRGDVAVVHDFHLVPAERARLAPPAHGRTLAATALAVPGRAWSTLLRHSVAPAYSLLRGQNGMSSSGPRAPAGAGSKSPVSAGTSLCGVKRPPFSLPSREPRNWTESAMISTDWRLLPCWSSHSLQSRRPSIATGRPLERYWAQFSPCGPHTLTLK